MKDVHHDHIAMFYGACVDPGNTYILLAYYPRGSLNDVLAKSDIIQDLLFKMSFALDILSVSFILLYFENCKFLRVICNAVTQWNSDQTHHYLLLS